MSEYDVVVIGSGPGGYVAAIRAGQLGLKTAIVEREPTERLGGTCLLRGCIPTKAMLHTADLVEEARRAEEFGVTLGKAEVDMEKMAKYRASIVQKNAGGVKYLMKKNKVDVFAGHGRIAGKNKISVEEKDGKTTTLQTRHCVLATGSACLHLPFIKMDHKRVIDSDDLLSMTEIPEHLVVIGAGAVGSEFASVFLRYGSKVTIIEMLERLLPIEDRAVSAEVEKSFKKQGMQVLTSSKVTEVKSGKDGVQIVVENDAGSQTIKASHLLVATGRRAVTDDCGIDRTQIELKARGFVPVSEYMQTSEPWVYAIGDIVDTPALAHLASHEAILAVDHLAGQPARPINYDHVPNCTYTSPEVASVGLTEEKARERGYDVKVGVFPFSAIGKAGILGHSEGFVKIVGETKYDELLGLHIVGPRATELIAEGVVALEMESTVAELVHAIHPHPTLSEAIGEAAHAYFDAPIHI